MKFERYDNYQIVFSIDGIETLPSTVFNITIDKKAELIEDIKDLIQILIILLVIGTFLAFNIADTHNKDIIHIDQDYTKSTICRVSIIISFFAIIGHIALVTVAYPPNNYAN